MNNIRYADAFCGVGGFSLGLKSIAPDAECVWAIDFNKEAAAVFKSNFGIECYGDIRKVIAEDVPDHDLLFGGFPCQPFSRNGKWFNRTGRIGDDEDRDNLFLELARILRAKQPKYFLFENVIGLLSMENRDGSSYLNTVVETLEACNYQVKVSRLDAANYGLPQQRKRVFFVGIRQDIKHNFLLPDILPRTSAIEDILESSVDDKYLLSNLWSNRRISKGASRLNAVRPNHSFFPGDSRFDAIVEIYNNAEKPNMRTGKIESVAILYGDTPSGLPRQQDKIYSVKGIAPTLATFSTPSVDSLQGFRQLTPLECARLQGLPDSHIKVNSDSCAYRLIGNSVPPPLVSAILKNLIK